MRLWIIGFALSLLAALTAMLSGVGTRIAWWDFRTGFTILKWGAYSGLAAVFLSLIGLIMADRRHRAGGIMAALAGLLIGIVVVGIPWSWLQTARSVPPIHDISTDLQNPPLFSAILPLRKDAPNPATYGGPEIAAQQRGAYPDLKTLTLGESPEQVFRRALRVVERLGWELVDAAAPEGRIEATATTFWFGFKDDVVIRITASNGGSAVDVRSVSRVGRSDVGANAERIKKFLKRLSTTA